MSSKFESDMLTPGEFFDRLTIIVRKSKFISEYINKVKKYEQILDKNDMNGSLIIKLMKLMMINTDIWNQESDIRKGKEGELGIKEVGERSLAIRDENSKRIKLVNEINEMFGIKEKESKFNHASQ
ncbi:MAG: hypothetical protein ACTSU7_01825 [Candidatus Heimdallarchaeaceae archaeon]